MKTVDNKFRQVTRPIRRKRRQHAPIIAARSLQALLHGLTHGRPPELKPHPIPKTFFGVNCSPSPDPAWDAVNLERIRRLGVGSVRVDVTYESDTEAFWRWVEALHGAGIDVVAHLVQPAASAANMHAQRDRLDWEQFVRAILEPVRDQVSHAEIGSTPNRHTWSGYSIPDYIAAHEIAAPILKEYGVRCIGPNVSDYAPYFSAALLGTLRGRGLAPEVHSDNLFVDRTGLPPEMPDHRAVGRILSPLLKLRLIKKLRHLAQISRWAGCEETWVTCFAWTVRTGDHRKSRYVELATQAAYLERYFLLAAASGHVQRVFWDQMNHHLRGLIDDGHRVRYDPPEVFLWRENKSCPGDDAIRPAFESLARLTRDLAGGRFVEAQIGQDEVAMTFERADGTTLPYHWKIASLEPLDSNP